MAGDWSAFAAIEKPSPAAFRMYSLLGNLLESPTEVLEAALKLYPRGDKSHAFYSSEQVSLRG
jgi:hypothetical protein